MGTILIFYKYITIEDPQSILQWQQEICNTLHLKGRVLISHEGINGTLGGTTENTNAYKNLIMQHTLFSDIDFKESVGEAEHFPRLSIKIRNEAVSLGIAYDKLTVENSGQHLTPEEAHTLIAQNPQDLVILDARNDYESKIGYFLNAIIPPIKNFRDLPQYLDENIEKFKNKQVLMYCTAGIRCERATAYLNKKNIAKKVYQIKGGIHRYVEKYPNGFFRGKNYVFDGRIAIRINDDILSTCSLCTTPCDDYNNCLNAECNKHFIACKNCIETLEEACSETCKNLIRENKVVKRPPFTTPT